jgi:hypothetical protein
MTVYISFCLMMIFVWLQKIIFTTKIFFEKIVTAYGKSNSN